MASNLKATGSAALSTAQTEHRAWIKGRAATLLAHYWRDDEDPALIAAMGKDWADVLEGLPQDAIQAACIRYQREEPRRRPTPGAIYQIAVEVAGPIKRPSAYRDGEIPGMPFGMEVVR